MQCQEYMAEGIPVNLVEFSDNRPVLDMLLSRPLGLLALLDEESRFPRATDRSFIRKSLVPLIPALSIPINVINFPSNIPEKCHNNIKSKYYIRPKSDAICFAIHHFAGCVVYQAGNFLEKNRNFLPAEVIQLIRGSNYEMIRFLFQCPITKTGNLYAALQDSTTTKHNHLNAIDTKERYNSHGLASQSRAQQTVATYFRYSLMDLLQKMVAGSPQFVRCIKPNDYQASKKFESAKVLKQLRCAGVLETIRIRQHGFSHRLTFGDFLKRYCFLAFGFNEKVMASRENCRQLLIRLKMDGWALGKSKVFLKYYHVEFLAKQYEEHLRKIILVQSCIRRWLAAVHFKRKKFRMAQSAMTLQRYVRGWLTRKRLVQLRNELVERQRHDEQEKLKKHQQQMNQDRESKTLFHHLYLVMAALLRDFRFFFPFFHPILNTEIHQRVKKALVKEKQQKHLFSSQNKSMDVNAEKTSKSSKGMSQRHVIEYISLILFALTYIRSPSIVPRKKKKTMGSMIQVSINGLNVQSSEEGLPLNTKRNSFGSIEGLRTCTNENVRRAYVFVCIKFSPFSPFSLFHLFCELESN